MVIISIVEEEMKGVGGHGDYRVFMRVEVDGNNVHIIRESCDPEGTWSTLEETDMTEKSFHGKIASVYRR